MAHLAAVGTQVHRAASKHEDFINAPARGMALYDRESQEQYFSQAMEVGCDAQTARAALHSLYVCKEPRGHIITISTIFMCSHTSSLIWTSQILIMFPLTPEWHAFALFFGYLGGPGIASPCNRVPAPTTWPTFSNAKSEGVQTKVPFQGSYS